MNDAGTAIRKAFFQLLNGSLSYSGTNVPIAEKLEDKAGLYVIMGAQEDSDRSNKHQFVTETTINIDVINLRESTANKEPVEAIAAQILALVLPTPRTIGLVIDAPFTICFCKFNTATSDALRGAEGNRFVAAKRITFRNRITQ